MNKKKNETNQLKTKLTKAQNRKQNQAECQLGNNAQKTRQTKIVNEKKKSKFEQKHEKDL